jgi:hypothetical protein
MHQSVVPFEWSEQARTQLVLPMDLRGAEWASFCAAKLEGYLPIDHADVAKIGTVDFQAAYEGAEADEWGVKEVHGLFVLARSITSEDTVTPLYVLGRGGKPVHYIHHSPRDTMRIVALLRECRRITLDSVRRVVLGDDRVGGDGGVGSILGGVEVTVLRTPPEEGVVDATGFFELAKRAESQYEWGFLLRNTAGGMGVCEGVETGGRQQYVIPGLRELEELANEQAVSRLLVVSAGRDWQVSGGGRVIRSCQAGKLVSTALGL